MATELIPTCIECSYARTSNDFIAIKWIFTLEKDFEPFNLDHWNWSNGLFESLLDVCDKRGWYFDINDRNSYSIVWRPGYNSECVKQKATIGLRAFVKKKLLIEYKPDLSKQG